MTDQIFNIILETSFTTHQLHRRVRILKNQILKKLFGSENNENNLEIETEKEWLSSLDQTLLNQINQMNYPQIFQELEQKITSLSPLVVYFAIEPDSSELDKIGGSLRKSYGPQFIFEPKFDPNLIGGCAFVWKGIYKDYSLRAAIEQNNQAITEIIKNNIRDHK